MKTTACPHAAEWTDFDLGTLPDGRHEELLEHLDSCAECADLFEKLESRPDGVVEQLRERLPEEVVADDSELEVLVSRAAALQQTGGNDSENTLVDQKSQGLAPIAEWIPQLLAPPQATDELGRLGGYRVLRVMGMGGMGVVLQAEDVVLKRLVALKVMKPKVASAEARARFLREAQAMAAVHHDHVVTIYQVGEDRGVPFLAMEFLEGQSLSDRLRETKKLSVNEALRIARETALGLAAAHAKGLTHRDIKPDNVWLERSRLAPRDESRGANDAQGQDSVSGANDAGCRDGFPVAERQGYRVKILDFGLARAADDEQYLTQSGAIVGTPNYL
ncbi:MAG: serine/threonine protein kinase [Planctomycetaceae bacterium]|nr:serine/threonine protein kinase [Planctomycetaceae bacterium]